MVEIIPYNPKLKKAFFDINHEWISNMFKVEPFDLEVISHPEEMILDKGGHIWFANHPDHGVIGTCALRKTGEGEFELIKMGVLEKARGLKAGETLLRFVIQFARQSPDIQLCFLLTNSNCQAAIHLYEKNGFEHSDEIKQRFGHLYERCDIAMKLTERTSVGNPESSQA
jgi:ribosomal protein S18 acetylase RimI-like enzyme